VNNSHYIEANNKRTYLTKNGKPTIFLKKNQDTLTNLKNRSSINLSNVKNIERPKEIYNRIIKSPEYDDFYLETLDGKVYVCKNGKTK